MGEAERSLLRRALPWTVLALVAIVGPNAIRSFQDSGQAAREGQRVCDAVESGDLAGAVALGRSFERADASGRLAAECTCWALLAEGRRDECAAHLESRLAAPGGAEWVPDEVLTALVVESRRARGRHAEAADLAGRAARVHRDALRPRELELMSRSAVVGEEQVLGELEAALAETGDDGAVRDRVVLSRALRRRGDHARAAAVLGTVAPPVSHPLASEWVVARTGALAALADLAGVQQTFAVWRRAGGPAAEIDAHYALCLSEAPLADPAVGWIELLEAALARRGELVGRPELVRRLTERLISHQLAAGDVDAALAVVDQAGRLGVVLRAISREQIESARVDRDPTAGPLPPGRLVFRSSVGGVLYVSPPVASPPDADYEALPLAAGVPLAIERGRSAAPVRWVLRGSDGTLQGSGAAWPGVERQDVEIVARHGAASGSPGSTAPATARDPLATRMPPDGRRRVFALLLDCADWRLTQYLRARGELPFVDAQLRGGWVAVLESRPALTAAALGKLVRPASGEPVTFVGLAHRLGDELGGLAVVGRNPLGFLTALLPETEDLFTVVGSGPYVAANMLFSHGAIDAGRSAEIVGPHGRRTMAPAVQAYRPLGEAVARRWPRMVERPGARSQVESIASAMDAAEEMAREGRVDLLLLRVEALDILTHALFGELMRAGQDDGKAALLDVYRYLDERLAALATLLDADDVLVVMSDHGIRTPMEHAADAIFVATGQGVPRGRAPGRPELAGVSRVLVGLLGIEPEWPDTGVAAWVGEDPGSGAPVEAARLVPQHGFEP